MTIKFRSLSLKEFHRLKVFEGRVQKNIGGSDTENNRGEKEKICVKYVVGRLSEEEWQAEDMLHVWTKRDMCKLRVLQAVRSFL